MQAGRVNTDVELVVDRVDPARSDDRDFVEQVVALVNEVYVDAESGMWRDDSPRTSADEISRFAAAGELVTATRPGRGLVGVIRVHDVDPETSEFGMLAAAPDQRNLGVGRALVDAIEQDARDRGMSAMQLELLVPTAEAHPSKVFLASWYGRRGYRQIATVDFAERYPDLAPRLAVACELQLHRLPLD